MAPLIVIPGTIYFGISWLVYRHNILFVYVKHWESYGRHWTMAFDQSLVGLFVYQVTLTGLLITKQAPILASFILPLIPLTLMFRRHCKKAFEMRTRYVPLDQLTVGQKEDEAPSSAQSPIQA
ncbi:hypothetical protein HK102_001476, partial [Quaeritorhiza haematococci]